MSHAEAGLPNLRNPIGNRLGPGPVIGFTGALKEGTRVDADSKTAPCTEDAVYALLISQALVAEELVLDL